MCSAHATILLSLIILSYYAFVQNVYSHSMTRESYARFSRFHSWHFELAWSRECRTNANRNVTARLSLSQWGAVSGFCAIAHGSSAGEIIDRWRYIVDITRTSRISVSDRNEGQATVAPTFITSITFVTAHQFCQFISTVFVNFCQLRPHQFCQQYQPLMSLQTRSLLLSTRPDNFCQP